VAGFASYPLIAVARLKESRDFFTRLFGMSVVFEASWVVMLAHDDGGPIAVGLMTADHPSQPPGPETFDGQGMILTFQVEDAAAAYARLQGLGAPIAYDLKEEPWGQKRFMVRVEQVEPAPGFWDKYMAG
jgi:uncharacterized glyoxalase superfamily protein PhnB